MFDYDVQSPRYNPWSQFSILLLLCSLGVILGSLVIALIGNAVLQVPSKDLAEVLINGNDPNLSRMIQFVNTFFIMALPSIAFAKIMNKKPFAFIGFNGAISGKQVFLIVGIIFMGLYVSDLMGVINQLIPIPQNLADWFKQLEDENTKAIMAIANMKSVQDYIISLIMIALLPALFEEMLFRGALQPIMIKITKNAFAGIFLTSVLFSIVHASYYGFLPRLALGMMIGYVFHLSRNLWLSAITHFLYNAFLVTVMYALSMHGQLTAETMNDINTPVSYGLLALISIFVVFNFFKRESEVVISMYNFHKKKF